MPSTSAPSDLVGRLGRRRVLRLETTNVYSRLRSRPFRRVRRPGGILARRLLRQRHVRPGGVRQPCAPPRRRPACRRCTVSMPRTARGGIRRRRRSAPAAADRPPSPARFVQLGEVAVALCPTFGSPVKTILTLVKESGWIRGSATSCRRRSRSRSPRHRRTSARFPLQFDARRAPGVVGVDVAGRPPSGGSGSRRPPPDLQAVHDPVVLRPALVDLAREPDRARGRVRERPGVQHRGRVGADLALERRHERREVTL